MSSKVTNKFLPWVDASQHIKPTAIVLHWWQAPIWFGGINYLVRALKRRGLSVQFAVLASGEIYQLVPDPTVLCFHARCANQSSIGIEIQGRGARDLDKNQEQFKAVVRLVKRLSEQFSIPSNFSVETAPELRFNGITSHKIVDKYCRPKRLIFKKRDVHDAYVEKVRIALG